jgi:SOS regulatory protein LexA
MPITRQVAATKNLERLKRFYWRHKRMPSFGELATLLNFKSKNAARYLIDKWRAVGLVEQDATGRLIPGRAFYNLKVLGTVEAGWPSPAEEEMIDTISLDDWLISNKQSSFMLKVSGDSMIDAGIHSGDLVILDRSRPVKNGDIVVAEIDREWTVKFFEQRGGSVTLRPANKKYQPLTPKEELRLAGVVTAVIRKYHQ